MKARLLSQKGYKPGNAPGALDAPEGALDPVAQIICYDPENLEEIEFTSIDDIPALLKKWPLVWINVSGLADVGLIEQLGIQFGIHPLALEDVVHIPQRAKVEEFENCLFAVFRMAVIQNDAHALEQVSLFLGKNFVLTFQERPGDVFEPIRERIRKGRPRIRMARPDYLVYALMDAVVDGYFPVLELYSDRLDALEERILNNPTQKMMEEVYRIKRELQLLRHCIWPLREAVGNLTSGEHGLVNPETALFLRDCQDHVIQVLDILENYRERISGLTDLYLSSISNKMNEVMKVLTIIATIFMPLGFLAGIYGMNFDTESPYNMPELSSPIGYPILLSVMALVGIGMLLYFKNLGWLGGGNKKKP
ncbi:MAG: magnesium transport protein CorA [Micavibrio sp.]|nr:MAG: magnesium transport protein CorA [Micavibrio sp.]